MTVDLHVGYNFGTSGMFVGHAGVLDASNLLDEEPPFVNAPLGFDPFQREPDRPRADSWRQQEVVDERVGAWRRASSGLGRGVAAVGAVLVITSCTTALPPTGRRTGTIRAGTRFAPLAQITPSNVASLRIAWTYHMQAAATISNPKTSAGKGDEAAAVIGSSFVGSEVTPLVVDDFMYVSTPYRRVLALDADTGSEVWAYRSSGARSTFAARRRILARGLASTSREFCLARATAG